MTEWFAVHSRDIRSGRDGDSVHFDTLKLAVEHAFDLRRKRKAEPRRIIGPTGEVVGREMLDQILAARARVRARLRWKANK